LVGESRASPGVEADALARFVPGQKAVADAPRIISVQKRLVGPGQFRQVEIDGLRSSVKQARALVRWVYRRVLGAG
jgi:hypothetical protein